MAEYIHKTEEIIERGKTVTFENKTDTSFDVSVGIVFHKSGLYRVSIVDEKVSVKKEHERTAEPKHGKWIPDKTGNSYWICTKCGFPSEASGAFALYHYCPNCGAKMEIDNE